MRRMYSESQLQKLIDNSISQIKQPEIYFHRMYIKTVSNYLIRFTFTDCHAAYNASTFLEAYKNVNFACFGGKVTGTSDEAHDVHGFAMANSTTSVLTLSTGSQVEIGAFTVFEDTVTRIF